MAVRQIIKIIIKTAKTHQSHYCTRSDLESPDSRYASLSASIGYIYIEQVLPEISTIRFHPCTPPKIISLKNY